MFSGSSYPMKLTGMLCDHTGSGKSEMVASKPEVPISQPVDKIGTRLNTISKGISMFLRYSYPIGQSRTLHDLTGSGNSKIVASKPEVCISRPVNMIGTQFQRLYPCFRGQATRRD